MTTYFEDLREGSEYLSAARTIRKEDITAFAGLSGDFSPLHTDDEWVRENTPFASRTADDGRTGRRHDQRVTGQPRDLRLEPGRRR